MSVTYTPNMQLVVPGVGTEPGPLYATDINQSLSTIDSHDHSIGKGSPVPASALNWDANISINNKAISNINYLSLTSLGSTLAGSVTSALYSYNGDLYYNNGSGNGIKMTAGTALNVTSTGISSGTANASFISNVLTVTAAPTVPANIDGASIVLRNNTANSKGITLSPPVALASDYILVLPSLPAQTNVMTLDSSGNMGSVTYNTVGTSMTSPGADGIAAVMSTTGTSSIVSTMTAANANTILSKMSYTPSHRNRIINGGMGIDQRNAGASQLFSTAGGLTYSVDRWYGYCTGANVTGARVAGSGNTLYRYQFAGYINVTGIGFGQRIESINAAYLASQTATLSVDLANSVLTTVTWTAYYANTADTFGTLASPTRTQIATGTFTVNSTVTRYSTQISMPSQAANGVEIVFTVGAQTSGTWTIGNVQLEAGSVATPFEARLSNETLMLCQRYCQVLNSVNDSAVGFSSALNNLRPTFHLKQTMRAAPTATISGTPGTDFGTDFRTPSAIALNTASINTATFDITVTANYTATAQSDRFYIKTTNGKIILAAELQRFNMSVTPNMGLVAPGVGSTPGPDYASQINADLTTLDQHNHTAGNGVPIPTAALNINSDLNFNQYSITNLFSLQLVDTGGTLNGTYQKAIYSYNGDLYYNNGSGAAVRITNGIALDVTSSGISSGTNNASFISNVLVVTQSPGVAANIDIASILLRNNIVGSKKLTLQPPNAMSADSIVTLPPIPAQTNVMTLDSSGNMNSITYDAVGQAMTAVGTQAIAVTMSNAGANTIAANVNNRTNANNVINLGLPPGMMSPYAGSTAPSGWLLCDGAVVSQTTYADLYAVIGATYNTGGEGAGNFRLPDTRGIFLSGAGSQTISGITYTRTLANKQNDAMQGHKHSVTDPGHRHSIKTAMQDGAGTQSKISSTWQGKPDVWTSDSEMFVNTTGLTVQNPTTDGTNGTPRTTSETRPANMAVNYIIKT